MIKKPPVREIRQSFPFNKNLIEITFHEDLELITFKFWNSTLRHGKEIDIFEISSKGCDPDSFEEFGNSCINSFCGGSLTNSEIREKAKQIFNSLLIFLKERAEGLLLNVKSNVTIKFKQHKTKENSLLPREFSGKHEFRIIKAFCFITAIFHFRNLLY